MISIRPRLRLRGLSCCQLRVWRVCGTVLTVVAWPVSLLEMACCIHVSPHKLRCARCIRSNKRQDGCLLLLLKASLVRPENSWRQSGPGPEPSATAQDTKSPHQYQKVCICRDAGKKLSCRLTSVNNEALLTGQLTSRQPRHANRHGFETTRPRRYVSSRAASFGPSCTYCKARMSQTGHTSRSALQCPCWQVSSARQCFHKREEHVFIALSFKRAQKPSSSPCVVRPAALARCYRTYRWLQPTQQRQPQAKVRVLLSNMWTGAIRTLTLAHVRSRYCRDDCRLPAADGGIRCAAARCLIGCRKWTPLMVSAGFRLVRACC
jgi:hypothetical protein